LKDEPDSLSDAVAVKVLRTIEDEILRKN